ncbi:MAG: aromatic ring-hydroxylating dioxygenase subunit alpha, partial [Halieaceae bacterium]|nr:aromatic ring-hydroxylating dioxygenase subunit alpha [Halieaceae bacterium]
AQQQLLEAHGDFQPRGLASDNALAQFRRVWFERIAEERKSFPVPMENIKNPVI